MLILFTNVALYKMLLIPAGLVLPQMLSSAWPWDTNLSSFQFLLLQSASLLVSAFAAMYGVAMAALGMLSTIATGLAIDAYGPISDNAGGIAEMAGMSHRIRERTDALDAAGNTTAPIGKGFAIGSAALVSLAPIWCICEPCRHFNCQCPQSEGLHRFDCWCHASLLVLRHDNEERGKCSFEDG